MEDAAVTRRLSTDKHVIRIGQLTGEGCHDSELLNLTHGDVVGGSEIVSFGRRVGAVPDGSHLLSQIAQWGGS